MRIKQPGNKLYLVFRLLNTPHAIEIVAPSGAVARKLARQWARRNGITLPESFSVWQDIYAPNRGAMPEGPAHVYGMRYVGNPQSSTI